MFVSAEGECDVDGAVAVDGDGTCLKISRGFMGDVDVTGPDRRHQAVCCVIGDGNRFINIAEGYR